MFDFFNMRGYGVLLVIKDKNKPTGVWFDNIYEEWSQEFLKNCL